jgi:tetratricopeptide (TPR) repeat protein
MTEEQAYRELTGDDPARAARAAAALWEIWSRSGVPEVDRLFHDGVGAMEARDFPRAENLFSQIIEIAPDFAEGWNKRATVRYLVEDYAGAIADCEETVRRKPRHFGALSGQGLCHVALGQMREAAALFRRCLEVYPHLTAARQNLAAALGEVVQKNGYHGRPNASASSS